MNDLGVQYPRFAGSATSSALNAWFLMIRCVKCAHENPDDALACGECGHKLQSLRQPVRWRTGDDAGGGLDAPSDSADGMDPRGVGFGAQAGGPRLNLTRALRYAEACGYATLLVAGLGVAVYLQESWPAWSAGGLVLVVAWLRGMRWKDG